MLYFEYCGRIARIGRSTVFHAPVTSHQQTKVPITTNAPRASIISLTRNAELNLRHPTKHISTDCTKDSPRAEFKRTLCQERAPMFVLERERVRRGQRAAARWCKCCGLGFLRMCGEARDCDFSEATAAVAPRLKSTEQAGLSRSLLRTRQAMIRSWSGISC